jgi:hypothetical protein
VVSAADPDSTAGSRYLPPPIVVGRCFALLVALLVSYWLAGSLFPTIWSDHWESSLQITGIALTHSSLTAYLIASYSFTTRRTRRLLLQLIENSTLDSSCRSIIDQIDEVPLRSKVLALAFGLIITSVNTYWPLVVDLAASPNVSGDLALLLGNLLVWLVAAQIIMRRARTTFIVSRLARQYARVDLYELDRLIPFSRVGTLDVLICAGALSLLGLQSIDAQFRFINYVYGFIVGIPTGLLALVLPTLAIRRRARSQKKQLIEELDSAIASLDRSLEPAALHHMNDVLARRAYIRDLREWPMDTTALSRVAFYIIIPPLAWVGAALVEILVNIAMEVTR